ncbi:MAG: MoxR family ATPase [Caldilineaceae bacterium]|nr:MoxR family ATPase [Caldilineaceae bacterium]
MPNESVLPATIDDLQRALLQHAYIADRGLATSLFLALKLGRPLLLEGEPGVGKTEAAKAMAAVLGGELIRLQCYEGIDASQALYAWDYPRQLMHLRYLEAQGEAFSETELYASRFLLKRPLLQALEGEDETPRVLLIDEIDRSDDEFEAFLLEILADFQITIPELGVVRAQTRPLVILTSNRTRALHDALTRRCLYCWIDYPDFDAELAIVQARAPRAAELLARQATGFVQALRAEELYKRPGVAETLDWVQALVALDQTALEEEWIQATLGVLLKDQADLAHISDGAWQGLWAGIRSR